ncbi:hypothetical protein Pelo_9844 [Pelomyxa schiedti]|nr:hypothetical protein Pelo_9844 [Pelomyxa schiedti]
MVMMQLWRWLLGKLLPAARHLAGPPAASAPHKLQRGARDTWEGGGRGGGGRASGSKGRRWVLVHAGGAAGAYTAVVLALCVVGWRGLRLAWTAATCGWAAGAAWMMLSTGGRDREGDRDRGAGSVGGGRASGKGTGTGRAQRNGNGMMLRAGAGGYWCDWDDYPCDDVYCPDMACQTCGTTNEISPLPQEQRVTGRGEDRQEPHHTDNHMAELETLVSADLDKEQIPSLPQAILKDERTVPATQLPVPPAAEPKQPAAEKPVPPPLPEPVNTEDMAYGEPLPENSQINTDSIPASPSVMTPANSESQPQEIVQQDPAAIPEQSISLNICGSTSASNTNSTPSETPTNLATEPADNYNSYTATNLPVSSTMTETSADPTDTVPKLSVEIPIVDSTPLTHDNNLQQQQVPPLPKPHKKVSGHKKSQSLPPALIPTWVDLMTTNYKKKQTPQPLLHLNSPSPSTPRGRNPNLLLRSSHNPPAHNPNNQSL